MKGVENRRGRCWLLVAGEHFLKSICLFLEENALTENEKKRIVVRERITPPRDDSLSVQDSTQCTAVYWRPLRMMNAHSSVTNCHLFNVFLIMNNFEKFFKILM